MDTLLNSVMRVDDLFSQSSLTSKRKRLWESFQPISHTKLIMLSALIGLVAHVSFCLLLPRSWQQHQSSDYSAYYAPVARNLVSGQGLTLNGHPALQYPPGIPALYAAMFRISDTLHISQSSGMRMLEAISVSTTSVMVAFLAMLLWNFRIAILAAVLWSTYPLHLWLTQQPDPATAFTAVLLLGTVVLVRSSQHHYPVRLGCILGFILGIAALLKPTAIALPAVVVLLVFVCATPDSARRRAVFALCVVIFYLLAISPWEVWARRTSGKWVPLCTNSSNVLIDGLTLGTVRGLRPLFLPSGVLTLTADAVSHAKTLNSVGNVASFLVAKAETQPGIVVQFFATKAVLSWYGTESRRFYRSIILIQSLYGAFAICGAILIWRGTRQQKNLLWIATAITLYLWSITTLTALPDLRYLIPATSLLMIPVALAVDTTAFYFLNRFNRNQ